MVKHALRTRDEAYLIVVSGQGRGKKGKKNTTHSINCYRREGSDAAAAAGRQEIRLLCDGMRAIRARRTRHAGVVPIAAVCVCACVCKRR